MRGIEGSSNEGRDLTFRNGRDSVKSRGRRSTQTEKKSYRTSHRETASHGGREGQSVLQKRVGFREQVESVC